MCFSATASFAAGIALSTVGVITLKKSEATSQLMFAAIPLIFGLQQLTEGIVWMALNNPEYAHLKTFSVYTFMAFAQIIWPSWVPISILLLEKRPARKNLLYLFSAIGLIVSIYLGYCLVSYPVDAQVKEHHIFYDLKYPMGLISKGVALYLLAIIFTPFLSSIKKMWVVGLVTLLSFVAAKLIFSNFVISVWCMFAAIISVVVWFMMPHLNEHYRLHKLKISF
jgi:hypothetical protein